jgi:hypothetical protein
VESELRGATLSTVEVVSMKSLMLDLEEKLFNATIINILKKLKETIFKELKESMPTIVNKCKL